MSKDHFVSEADYFNSADGADPNAQRAELPSLDENAVPEMDMQLLAYTTEYPEPIRQIRFREPPRRGRPRKKR